MRCAVCKGTGNPILVGQFHNLDSHHRSANHQYGTEPLCFQRILQAASVLRGTHTTDVCKIHPFSRRQKGGSACTDKALPIFDSLAAGKLQFPLHRMYPADPSPHVQVQLHAAGQLLQAAIRKQTRPIQRPFYVICGQHRIGGRKSLIAQYMDFSLGIARTNSARCMITRISKSNDCVVYHRAPPFCRKIAEFFPLFLF